MTEQETKQLKELLFKFENLEEAPEYFNSQEALAWESGVELVTGAIHKWLSELT